VPSPVGPAARTPLFFASSGRSLFGCYHAPPSGTRLGCGAILCHPMGEEYIRFHRAYRLLSDRLAGVGIPVLRFDYYGCGDSSGKAEQGRLSHWRADVAAAVDEMRRRGDITKVCLVGLRLGGSLAVLSGAERGDIDAMVLWDPVVWGQDYLAELADLHTSMLQHAHVKPRPGSPAEEHDERLGFPLTASLRSDLETLDLLDIRDKPAASVLVIQSNGKADPQRLCQHLQGLGTNLTFQRFLDPRLWVWEEAVGRILVPQPVLQSVVSWLSGACA
jgi:alpha-beta hydrolase superfamily lysophospholipase